MPKKANNKGGRSIGPSNAATKHVQGDWYMVYGGVIDNSIKVVSQPVKKPGKIPGGQGVATWSYATLSAAESSGDGWSNNDVIRITTPNPDVDFIYHSSLNSNGHSGLRHKDPFGDGAAYATSVLTNGEGVATDPDTWNAKWVESANVYASLGVLGGRSRFVSNINGITSSFNYTPTTPADAQVSMLIARKFLMNCPQNGGDGRVILISHISGSSRTSLLLFRNEQLDVTNLLYRNSAGTNVSTSIANDAEIELFMYTRSDAIAIWDGVTLEVSGASYTAASAITTQVSMSMLNPNGVQDHITTLETMLVGYLET